MRGKNMAYFVLGAALAAGGLFGVAVGDLVVFKAGDPIKASEVNGNFSTLKSAIAALETGKQNRVNGTCAQGSSIRVINADGTVTCETDDVGSGGSSYTAGFGLKLAGAEFSLDVAGTPADGKVLKLQGGALTWADDLLGSGGSTYNADSTSLQLTGNTFSVKDAGVSTAKIADGAITGGKIAQSGATSGQVLKWNGSTWAPAADLDTNTTYTAGAGLGLASGAFSIANAGVTTAMLADASVTGAKLAFPINLSLASGGSSTPLFKLDNSERYAPAIWGNSFQGVGVQGTLDNGAVSCTAPAGVCGTSGAYYGVLAISTASSGVFGVGNSASARGVWGYSSAGTGVLAQSDTGTALEVSGPIKVSGAAARRAAFVHVKTPTNTAQPNQTCTDITDANAMVFATHNYTASGSTVLNAAIGVFYSGSKWCIYREDLATLADGQAFNVLVIYQ